MPEAETLPLKLPALGVALDADAEAKTDAFELCFKRFGDRSDGLADDTLEAKGHQG